MKTRHLTILIQLLFCCMVASPNLLAASSDKALTAHKIDSPPSINGIADDTHWHNASNIRVLLDEQPYEPDNGYKGMKKTTVTVQALYDERNLYMKFEWKDKTNSLNRFPWEKQKNGQWKQLKNLDSTLHENTYYEDKLAVYWNISERGFTKKGCDKSCHMAEDGKLEGLTDTSSGRHYTKDGFLDEWHWKATRTNINAQMDDGYLDSEHNTNDKWGRHADDKTGGGYYNNVLKDNKNTPAWMNEKTQAAAGNKPIYHLVDAEKNPFKDLFEPGDRLPGIVTAPFEGSRGDITAKAVWNDGIWTLEIKRKLITESKNNQQDLQFTDLTQTYSFGITAFDNSQIAHVHHTGSLTLAFGH